jgi:hypothetical protein
MKSVTIAGILLVAASPAVAQHSHDTTRASQDSSHMIGAADAAMAGHMSAEARAHLELSPERRATRDDSVRAREVVQELRTALAKYGDTSAAVADGYRMFMPNVKTQRVFHFTNRKNAFKEAFRFDAKEPTSLLYQREADGSLKLIGAMYTAPKRTRPGKLDERMPLSIARWHKHVRWCLPRPGEAKERWQERRDGKPVFGPESPITTRQACQEVGGVFLASPLGWMIHANVFLGDDLATVFGHDH